MRRNALSTLLQADASAGFFSCCGGPACQAPFPRNFTLDLECFATPLSVVRAGQSASVLPLSLVMPPATLFQKPQRTLWAALRSEPASGCDGEDGGVRSAAEASLAGPSGLLRRDGRLAPCGSDGSAPHLVGDVSGKSTTVTARGITKRGTTGQPLFA